MVLKEYFTFYCFIKNFLVRMQPKNVLRQSKAVDAALIVTAFGVLNIRFLLKVVLFPDDRLCQACTLDKRQGLLIISSIALGLVNLYLFRKQPEERVGTGPGRLRAWVYLLYMVSSISLAFIEL